MTTRVSSPASTGGAGTFFEQHVGAYWLAQLLVGGIPPILISTSILEVHFQTERLGWHTDDFLIVCDRVGARPQKLAGQIKRTFTVSAANEECKKAIGDSWKDFNSADRFSQEDDRLVLATLRGTNTLLEHFVGLLDCARAARDGAEFEQRLAIEGLVAKDVVRYCGELQNIVGALEARTVSPAGIWPFLRVLHVLSLDLHTPTRQTEAQIKSLLKLTATAGDGAAAAAVSWNELLGVASAAMSEGRSLRRSDLPEDVVNRHTRIATNEHRPLAALGDHTQIILRGIRSTIGQDIHLSRAGLVQQVRAALESSQIVLITGPAGSGKSAVGKNAILLLAPDHFAFGFRAEEFAQPHFDATLHAAQVPANAQTLGAILAGQGRKVVVVESLERLLERSTRDAFADLLTLASSDRSLQILLTCRDYSAEQVRASFLQLAAIKYAVVEVPPLADAELAEVEAALPALAHPLKNPALRDILRNPYLLDKALQITWSTDKPVPESEGEFRALFWRDIVRAEHRIPAGLARQRERVLQEIAARRARALSPFVAVSDLDADVVASLLRDSLIIGSDKNPAMVATAHDVLEDWAILEWIEAQHLTGEGSFKALSAAIGAHPAVRRSYRKWVAELVSREPEAADRLFKAATAETEVTAQFRDDTLVSLLKAPSAPAFLLRHEAELVANDNAILERVIHLLRVACVTTPAWLAGATGGSIFNYPTGSAWPTVLELVARNISRFTQQDRPLLLGLIEDAVRGVSWWAPTLEGAEHVAVVAHWLLPGAKNYRAEDFRNRVLKVIVRIPSADPIRFEAVLRGTATEDEHDRTAEELRDILLSGTDGLAAARDLPDLVISVATEYLLASEDDLQRNPFYSRSLDLHEHFGIKEGLKQDFFPASALRGPWVAMLRYHPRKALAFLVNVFNHSIDWYVHPRVPDPLEPGFEVELTFADGAKRKQWLNARLWNLYRGTSVGPYVLQSLLMSLEKWLLELGTSHPKQLDGVLVYLLRNSDSAALAAVVASVATAYPHAAGEALLVLLSVPEYIAFDRARMAAESQARALNMFPQLRSENKIFEQERKEADNLLHRRQDLEVAVSNLQFGPLAPRVHAILDAHLAVLPPKAEQKKSHLLWRLSIHRMDMRQYTVSDIAVPEVLGPDSKPGEAPKQYVRLEPNAPDADVQAMIDESAPRFNSLNARASILVWGLGAFERDTEKHDPLQWREKLTQAREMRRDDDPEQHDGTQHGPGFIAAVCVRDHWDEMSDEERGWCVDRVCAEVLEDADDWNHFERSQRNPMAADRASASVVPLLLGRALSAPQETLAREAFAAAFTHPSDEVRWYAISGIDASFWKNNRLLALRCVNAIATESAQIDRVLKAEESRPYNKRRSADGIVAEAAKGVRQRFWNDGTIAENAHRTVDIADGFGAHASGKMLAILIHVPEDPVAVALFARVAQALVNAWDARDDHRREGKSRRRQRDYQNDSSLETLIEQFVMRTDVTSAQDVLRPVLEAVERHPRETHNVVQGLTNEHDSRPNASQYWFLWNLFADAVKRAKWVGRLDGEHPWGSEMLSSIFLTSWWEDNVRHWKGLEGHAHNVDALFDALPPTSIVLDSYVRFLYHIGERSLPQAFVRIAESLTKGNAATMLERSNTVFLLEVLLQRHVYGKPLELKRDAAVRKAVLFLLDTLVDNGSSAAFRMRDDFVTPASA
jgi:hypothetical protein